MKKILLLLTLCVFSLFTSVTAFAVEETTDPAVNVVEEEQDQEQETVLSGFVEQEGVLYYYIPETGELFLPEDAGIEVIEGKAYLMNADGSIVRYNPEFPEVSFLEKKYYLNEDNSLASGLKVINDKTYYYSDSTYELITGWVSLEDGKRYFDAESAEMLIGLQSISDVYYYFDSSSGIMKTGWIETEDGKRYFGKKDGIMMTGLKKIGGKYYYLDFSSGTMQTGWVNLEDGKRYFGKKDGIMMTGLKKIGGKYYNLDSTSGIIKTGWITYDKGQRYFSKKSGELLMGLNKIGGKYYYLSTATGYKKAGWIETEDGKRYFRKKDGIMLTGLEKIGGKYYYFDRSSGLMKTGWVTFDSGKRYFDKKTGVMKTGWVKSGENKYYFSSKGIMAQGWKKISNDYYYFNSNGKMAKSTLVGEHYVLKNGKRATSDAVKYAAKLIKTVSKDGMTTRQKLKACYTWIYTNCSYERDYENPAKLTTYWPGRYASYLLSTKRGNCYKYASAMAYCAELLGYDSRVAYGKVYLASEGMTAHGWAEITVDGTLYTLDPNMVEFTTYDFFMKTYSNYPCKLEKAGTVEIVLS